MGQTNDNDDNDDMKNDDAFQCQYQYQYQYKPGANDANANAVHHILSRLPYGEEDDHFLAAISTEVALQVPWTSQLRLCLRSSSLNLLLPHVWNKVQLIDDSDNNDVPGDDSWRHDYMIQHWSLTRFHVTRDPPAVSRSFLQTLRQIMERIDRVLGIMQMDEHEPFLTFNGSHPIAVMGKPPLAVLANYAHRQKETPSTTTTTMHLNFSAHVAKYAEFQGEQETYLELCQQIGVNRKRLQRILHQWDSLPLQRLAQGLVRMHCTSTTTRRARALLAGLLKRQGVDIQLDPLPQELIYGNDQASLETLIDSYLSHGLPNVNSLVVFLWTHQRVDVDLVTKYASWLPVEPIVPLLQRVLLLTAEDHQSIKQGIDFFLALEWEEEHGKCVFEPLLGQDIPTDPAALKQACIEKRLGNNNNGITTTKQVRPKSTMLTTNAQLVEQVWGKEKVNGDQDFHVVDNCNDIEIDESDDDFDETDDRILLL